MLDDLSFDLTPDYNKYGKAIAVKTTRVAFRVLVARRFASVFRVVRKMSREVVESDWAAADWRFSERDRGNRRAALRGRSRVG